MGSIRLGWWAMPDVVATTAKVKSSVESHCKTSVTSPVRQPAGTTMMDRLHRLDATTNAVNIKKLGIVTLGTCSQSSRQRLKAALVFAAADRTSGAVDASLSAFTCGTSLSELTSAAILLVSYLSAGVTMARRDAWRDRSQAVAEDGVHKLEPLPHGHTVDFWCRLGIMAVAR